ncbi:hypothetical protein MPER_12092 [Moniliophthora perniciosa FA553]|nr:hypothetical protein MPER_12092 [Moniliophthora perniciosa FA553]
MFNDSHGYQISGGAFNNVRGNQYNNGNHHYEKQDNRRYNNNNWGGTQNNNNGDGDQTNHNANVPTYDATDNDRSRSRERSPKKRRGERKNHGDYNNYDDDEYNTQPQPPSIPSSSRQGFCLYYKTG